MPNLNGTGPLGQGSGTGGKMGRCHGAQKEQIQKSEDQSTDKAATLIGLGRGGKPFGGGMGKGVGNKNRPGHGHRGNN